MSVERNIDGYVRLAHAIVEKAGKDYRAVLKKLKRNPEDSQAQWEKMNIERFFRRDAGAYMDVDGDYIIDWTRMKGLLRRYKKRKKELLTLEQSLERLHDRLESVPTVSGKVEKSGDDFPYIREHISVEVPEPAEATRIKLRISEKERQKTAVLAELDTVESYIAGLPEGLEKTILESIYLDDMTQEEVARMTGYTQGRIAQIVAAIKD